MGVILGVYRDNGQENGNHHSGFRVEDSFAHSFAGGLLHLAVLGGTLKAPSD